LSLFYAADEFPIDFGSFLDAEFKNDIRFSQSNVTFEIIDFKSRKIANFAIFEDLYFYFKI